MGNTGLQGKIHSVVRFPGGSDGKEPAHDAGDFSSIPESKRSLGEGNCYPTPIFLPGEVHGQRSLAAYSPWGHKGSDTTEVTNTFTDELAPSSLPIKPL